MYRKFCRVIGITYLLFLTSSAFAQSVEGKNYLNLGFGALPIGFSGSGGFPLSASFEHGFTDKISAGGFVSFLHRRYRDDYRYRYVVVGARGSYHFNEELKISDPNLDIYAGASLYLRGYKLKFKGNGAINPLYNYSGSSLGLGVFAGGRYMLQDNIGAFAELGYSLSALHVGITFTF